MRFRVTAAIVLAAVPALTAGCAASTSSAPSARVHHYERDGVSFDYPSRWKHRDWCWEGTTVTPLVVLTTTSAAPACDPTRTPWFPPETLGRNGLSVWWDLGGAPGLRWSPTVRNSPPTRIDGQPARTAVLTPHSRQWSITGCSGTGGTLAMITEVAASAADNYYDMTACVRGPHFTANERAVRRMLASVRFRRSS